jgi:hypothetical protein
VPAAAEPALRAIIDGHEAELPQLSVEGPGGVRCWFQRSQVDCFRPAAATALGVDYDELEGVRSLGDLIDWAAARGSRVNFHLEPPDDGRLWIGVTPPLLDGEAAEPFLAAGVEPNHTFVGWHGKVFHDPASGWRLPPGIETIPPTEAALILTVDPA